MKTFTVAVAVAIALTFICTQESSAVPVTEGQEMEEPMSVDAPAAADEETSVETWMMPYDIRGRSSAAPIRCQFCCGCCNIGVCGMCCT
ncbi:hepcidin-like [Odontesthes bonariensis]|uniref:hepcidin-like n=1 Tax=Odontesthes bonariensis TaxID=219752 RepID=UPI003F58A4B3